MIIAWASPFNVIRPTVHKISRQLFSYFVKMILHLVQLTWLISTVFFLLHLEYFHLDTGISLDKRSVNAYTNLNIDRFHLVRKYVTRTTGTC